jgi:uncharacterized OB-fold protein
MIPVNLTIIKNRVSSQICLSRRHYGHVWMYSVHYIKRPGATLDAGTAIAKLELDDPSKVQLVCS